MKKYTDFEFKKLLSDNGYKFFRMASGDHVIYYNSEKNDYITMTSGRAPNICICQRLIKEHNLIIKTKGCKNGKTKTLQTRNTKR